MSLPSIKSANLLEDSQDPPGQAGQVQQQDVNVRHFNHEGLCQLQNFVTLFCN